jgi:hypothetical protein
MGRSFRCTAFEFFSTADPPCSFSMSRLSRSNAFATGVNFCAETSPRSSRSA